MEEDVVLWAKSGPAAGAYRLHPGIHTDVFTLTFLAEDMWELEASHGNGWQGKGWRRLVEV